MTNAAHHYGDLCVLCNSYNDWNEQIDTSTTAGSTICNLQMLAAHASTRARCYGPTPGCECIYASAYKPSEHMGADQTRTSL